jgi:predicted Zn finger-like uncharacterized protein
MYGTTVCPHCDARFKISKEQLAAHHGMVRCGQCMEAFDVRINFVPDQLDLQLELPILEEPVSSTYSKIAVLQPMTLAEQVAFIQDGHDTGFQSKRRTWPWAIASLLLLLLLCAQAAYFFRVDLAARLPNLKPALTGYCKLLNCTLPLPRHTDLISIESSDLEADPAKGNRIVLSALLRNRAPYAQAFPDLELTLNDSLDMPLARRMFTPTDYLSAADSEAAGLQPNLELSIKLYLDTADLEPSGYRLVMLYSNNR